VSARVLRYRCAVNFFEGALVFVGIPLLVVLVVGVLTVGRSRAQKRTAYVPGGKWEYSDRLYVGDTPVDVEVAPGSTDETLGGARGTW
jgi:hypothetical protein